MKTVKLLLIAVLACTTLHSCEKSGDRKAGPVGQIECGGEKVTARYPLCQKASSGMGGVDPWTGDVPKSDSYYLGISSIENDFVYSHERSCVYVRLDSFENREFDITDKSVVFFCFRQKYHTTESINRRAFYDRWKKPGDPDDNPEESKFTTITGGKVKVKWAEKSCILELSLSFKDGGSAKISGEIDRDFINKNLGI